MTGTAEQITCFIQADNPLKEENGRQRYNDLVSALVLVLVHLRDTGAAAFDIDSIQNNMQLDLICALILRTDIPGDVLQPLRHYVSNLPRKSGTDTHPGDLDTKSYEIHGFLTMKLLNYLPDLP